VYFGLTFYLAGLAIGQLACRPLSDRFGRRSILLIGLALYCAGSALCAVATDIGVFLAGRVLQAIGGCSGLVLGRAMVRDTHRPDRAASIIGYTVMVTTVATGVSPAARGSGRELRVACDLCRARADGRGGARLGGPMGAGVATMGTARARRPMLLAAYSSLPRERRFLRFSIYSALLFASFNSFVPGVPIVVIDQWGYSALAFSAWWTIGSLSYILGNFLAGRYSQKLGIERMLGVGAPLIGGGAVLFVVLLALELQHPSPFSCRSGSSSRDPGSRSPTRSPVRLT
jgi:MFS transporter, DHA1 family, multidrug resistance protein